MKLNKILYEMRLLCFTFLILGCASGSKSSVTFSLQDLCSKAATDITQEIEGKAKSIAILDIQTEYWSASDYVVNELTHYFTRRFGNGNVIAHDDFTRSLILDELLYQQSGMVSDETIQEIGQELGVDAVITGQISETSSGYDIFVKATQTESKRQLSSWKGSVKKSDSEMKFQVEKSKRSERPQLQSYNSNNSGKALSSSIGLSAKMINEKGENVSVLHPGESIRFSVSCQKNVYVAIICIDAQNEETWLPMQSNYIRAGESRIFPDIQGVVLKVRDGIYGKEQVKIYASTVESELPKQGKMLGTRAFKLGVEGAENAETVIDYRVER